ncbi:Zn(2)-C6 fungal-type domain-containing protein [Mycena sanguinolenta]|uniref:Zn(2)-C6 fungal-type domain-containing protein n=1 Tax=Mycena sanguinolenta TaxID=230812 RepID=A0A8H6Y0B1_9AGAR|nr:Zn(2)-C6 fungal-type domain-containing protein [Mycena sanguinolenta]
MAPDNESCRPLRRGKACLNCRHLKIKCNGVRPVCGSCTRVPKEDECEYTDTMSRTQRLEHTVSRLQMRLKELQNGRVSSKPVGSPRLLGSASARITRRPSHSGSSSGSDTSSTFPNLKPSRPASSSLFPSPGEPTESIESSEPPRVTKQMLLDSFLPHAAQFGFFLYPERFRAAALKDEPGPSTALLCAVSLCGAHISQTPFLLSLEPTFLRRARQYIATEISADMDLTNHLHTIQALVLFSTYLMRIKRFLEAEFYANGAVTLALGHQLHRITKEAYPATSGSTREEGERIRAFWAVACLQTQLNFSLNTARSASSILDFAMDNIDTPWPFKPDDYEAGFPPPGYNTPDSILHLLKEECFPSSPMLSMLHAKASVLLHHTTRLSTAWSLDVEHHDPATYTSVYCVLDRHITAFWKSLPPIYAYFGDDAASRTLAATHALTAAAAIRLHRCPAGVSDAQAKCLFAARSILDCLGCVIGAQAIVHPVVGALCSLACGVLIEEVKCARLFSLPGENKDFGGTEEAELTSVLQAGMVTMEVYAQACPLILYQLHKIRQQYEAM